MQVELTICRQPFLTHKLTKICKFYFDLMSLFFVFCILIIIEVAFVLNFSLISDSVSYAYRKTMRFYETTVADRYQ